LGVRESAVATSVGVAAEGLEVEDAAGASVEGGILVDRHLSIPATGLGVVTTARQRAHALVELLAVDRGATEADTIVLETGVAEAVALALGDTLLDRHVGVGLARPVDERVGPRGLVAVEAAGVDVGLEGVEA
jgi:hypothetical protein